jgi:hypothetical protein
VHRSRLGLAMVRRSLADDGQAQLWWLGSTRLGLAVGWRLLLATVARKRLIYGAPLSVCGDGVAMAGGPLWGCSELI